MYYTELSESILIVHPENLEVRKAFGVRHGLRRAWACVISGVPSGTIILREIGY